MKIAFNPSTVAALITPPNNKDITFDLRGRNIFARGVKFQGTDTWRDIKINNVSIDSNILDLQNGSNTTLTNTNGVVTINSTWRPVVDNLTSDSTTSSLSANLGRVLAGLINGKSDSGHNHDGRYLRLNGSDTMQGNLYLHSYGTSYIGKGSGDKSGADFTEANIVIRSWWGISFKSHDDIVRTYIDTRTGNIGTKGVLNAVGAVIQGRVYNGGDDEGIIVKPSPNGYAGLILGAHNGERSVFYFTKGNPFWRYNNGSTNLDILHPKKSGTIALTSDIPSSLKNPYSLTTFGVVYDGSAAKVVDPSNFISLVNEAASIVTDGTMFITSWASNNGFADTNAVNVPYKRKAIHLWEYIKAKTDSLYATKGHNHDDRYLKLTGGIMTGTIYRNSGGSTISGRDHAIIRLTYAPGGSSWNPIACVDTETGTWTLGHLSSGDSDTNFHFCFSTNTDYNEGNNNGNYVTLRNKVGTIALLSEIPDKNSWNYDDRYLKLTGGTMNGNARIGHGSGNLYIGNSGNDGWLAVQDICSQDSLGDGKWSIRVDGTASFQSIKFPSNRLIARVSSGSNSPLKGIKLPYLENNGIGIFSRVGNSTDEGGIVLSEDTCVIYNSFDTGWGLSVRDKNINLTDISGDNTIAFGIRQDYRAYSLGGFEKSGSNNSYVLLGGGGHKLESTLNVANADTVDGFHASSLVKFYLSPMTNDAPADSAKNWFVNIMPYASGAIVYNVPGVEKTIIAGKSSGAYGHMLQLNYQDTYLRILRYYNGSWKSTDWEKISAGYADSAGNADTLDGNHASAFATAGHNHNDLYVSSLTTNGNYLRWVKNGNNNDITIPYATGSSKLIYHSLIGYRTDFDSFTGESAIKVALFQNRGTDDEALVLPFTDGSLISFPWENNNNYGAQLAVEDSGQTNHLAIRNKKGSNTWGAWAMILTSVNYNLYSPKLDGTGASGTWGINITGNADTVDGQHFSYSNSSNSPTYLWATNSNGSSFLAARESISVNYANSAGTANVLLTNNTSQAADACYSENPGLRFWRYNGTSSTSGQGGGDGWIMSWSWGSGSVGGQIYVDDNPSKIMCIRGRNNDANKTFTTWATILHSDNYTSYCAAASHTHPYLPLSGGTMTGTIYFNNMQSGKDAGIDCTLGSRRMLFGIGTSGNAGIWELNKGWIMGMDTSNNVFIHGNADSATNADKVDGLHVHSGRNNEANKIVRTDANGYILTGWINTTSGDMGATTATRIYCSNDAYIRYKTLANFSSDIAGQLYWANVKVSTSSNATTSPTFESLWINNSYFFKLSGTTFTCQGGTTFTLPSSNINTSTALLWTTASDGTRDTGIFYNSSDFAFIANSNDHGAVFAVYDTDVTQDFEAGAREISVPGSGGALWARGGFSKSGSSNDYVLLGGGGHKALSDFMSSTIKYALSDTIGGNALLAYKLYYPSSPLKDLAGIDNFHEASTFKYALWNGNSEGMGSSFPGTENGIILSGGWTATTYGFQLAIDDDPNYFIALRQRGNGTWSTWKRIPMGDGTGASGTWGINITGNADTVDGYHVTSGNDKPWGTIPAITTSGWMDIGKHLEFHFDNTTGSDYSTILRCTGNYSNIVNLPSAAGTLALTSDIPTTLPANGGNADTTDGVHITWAGALTSTSHLVAWEADGSALRDINPANVTVGNSDKLDGYHANELLTALSNTNNGISITVGGTTKSISNISVNYAASAGSASSALQATNLTPENTPHYFRDPSNSGWRGGMYWGTAGNESMSFVAVNGGTRFQFVGGSDIANWTSSTWQSVTPYLTIYSSGIVTPGSVTATNGFIKSNSSDSYVLLGGGGHKLESSLRVAYATSAGSADTALYLRSLGNLNCQTGRTLNYGDVYTYNTYDGNTGSPTTFTSVIGFGRGIAGTVEIAGGWDNTNLYWRSLRDCCEDWHSWRTVLDSSNYTEYINNYYWANVKISTSSSTTTSPTVSNLTATNSIRMGNIYLLNTNEINSASGIHLNYQNSGNISLCYGGGKVGIGTTSPTYKLDVNGLIRASGFHHSSMNSDNYILLAGGGYKSFGGDSSHPVFLGYLNLDHGSDGTVSSSFSCLGYTVPFTYTRGGNYCKISIPDTTHQAFYIKAATASVNYSGGGMDTWTGNHRGAGAWWLHCYAPSSNEVRVKGFHLKDTNNDSWWGGNPLWSDRSGVNRITVCIFGYVTFR